LGLPITLLPVILYSVPVSQSSSVPALADDADSGGDGLVRQVKKLQYCF